MNVDFNNTRRPNFIGHDGFVWWIGVVENRMDPLNLGRCQVRIKGLHTDNLNQIDSKDLPWAMMIFPVNTSDSTPTRLKEGDMVIGFFMDGDAAQYPVVFGMFHGIPEDEPKQNSGFSDQRTADELIVSPRPPKSIIFNTDGSGAEIQENETAKLYPNQLNEPTTSRLCRNESIENTIINSKNNSLVNVQDSKGNFWQEPKSEYNTVYPYNQVTSTESGHYFEMDDTPTAERIHLYHRSGTFSEIHPDGSKVDKIVKNKYSITMKDDSVFIMGDCSITVQGNAKIYIQKECDLKVDADLNFNIGGNFNVNVSKNWKTNVEGTINQYSAGDTIIKSDSTIQLNPMGL